MIFYNEAAGMLLGKAFEEAGTMSAAEWGSIFGPFDDAGEPIPLEELPITRALREGRPVHANVEVRSATGERHEIELSALPIVGTDEFRGAMAIFWPISENGGRAEVKLTVWGARGSVPAPGTGDGALRR